MAILSGIKRVRRYIKESNGYRLLSQWTSSQTVEMDDGTTLESNKAGWDAAKTHANSAHATASTITPKVAGTATTGTNSGFARGDHVHPAQTTVSGNAGSATKLATARNINGISFDGSANRFNYGTCSTAASTVAKTVSCTGFTLATGSEITVKFTYANTAANPTLNVNSTGAKAIYYNGSAITSGLLVAKGTYTFRYNGAQWDLVGSAGSSGEDYADKAIYGDTAVSMGRKAGTTVGKDSFAFGTNVEADVRNAFAIGDNNTASGQFSFAEGTRNLVRGDNCHVEGMSNVIERGVTFSHVEGLRNTLGASLTNCHVMGMYNNCTARSNSLVCGQYNVDSIGVFIIGGGDGNARSNAFSVAPNGTVKAKSTITGSTTADYAEFFEWEDGNPNNEDRVGKFVTIKGDKISIAKSNKDYILGIVSGEPFVLGNGDCDTWNGMYLKDEFNRTIYEPAPKVELDVETGEMIEIFEEDGTPVFEGTRPKLNPDYDPNQPYISRFDRKEWAPVGMLGVLSVIHDGTCKVNGYCCCNSEGIATACDMDTKGACRVIQKMTDNVVRVILK